MQSALHSQNSKLQLHAAFFLVLYLAFFFMYFFAFFRGHCPLQFLACFSEPKTIFPSDAQLGPPLSARFSP